MTSVPEAFIVGVHTTPFKRHPEVSLKALTRQAVEGVLADAELHGDGELPTVDSVCFGNCGMHLQGQANIRGHVLLDPLIKEARLPKHLPITNVEGGCATGTTAFHNAWKDVISGVSDLSLAVGVEKTFMPQAPDAMMALFDGALDLLDPEVWERYYQDAAEESGLTFEPSPGRIKLLDICAMRAQWHMKTYGTTVRQMAASAAKNHEHGALNPNAQYQVPMTVQEVLDDKSVVGPFTRSMCAPISDGAAAVLVCSKERLTDFPAVTQQRAVRVLASTLTSGVYRRLDEPSLARVAADRAYAMAGVQPEDIDICELHDATSFDEIYLSEMLRFCEPGDGGEYIASGQANLGGHRPANMSGGLVSKGHPLGASGLAMLHELVTQIRGEAGDRQVDDVHVALQQNGGGMMGFDEAACGVTILKRC